MPMSFSAYTMMACEWTSVDNVEGADFKIYPTLTDALDDSNAWTSYAFGGSGIGFPATSGPTSASSDQYSSIAVDKCTTSSTGKSGNFYIYDYASSVVPGTCTRSVGTLGSGAECEHSGTSDSEARLGFLMFTKETRESRWSSQATGFAENFACVRFTGIEWQYLEGATWTQFVPLPTDVLLARIEFDNSSITDLKGEDEEFFTVKKGYVDGDLEFSSSSLASGIVEIVGTSFVARCGEDLWCRNGSRPEDVTGTLYCCDASCETCGGEDCGSDEANNICCLDTLLNAGRICRDHDDVSCLIPEASVLCGGNLQLNNFASAEAMAAAGWTINTSDANVWLADGYIGYRGSPSAGIALTLSGYGTLDLTFGNDNTSSSDTVEVFLNAVSEATATNSESPKTVAIDFTHGSNLEIKANGDAVIGVRGLAFKCMMQQALRRVVIKEGEFDAPGEYTSWPAEACYHEYELAGTWSGSVNLSSSSVSTASEGLFTVQYACSKDSVETTRSMIVEVRHPIKLEGLTNMILRQSDGSFSEPGVSCIDRDLKPLSVSSSPASLQLDEVGEFSITYSCVDSKGRTSTMVRYVQVSPAIELRGDAVVVLEKDSTWNDPGAQCVDTNGGLIIYTASPDLNMSTAAETTVTYSCTDSNGTVWTTSRLVYVTSNLPAPVLRGPASMTLLLGEEFNDPGVCCKDDHNQVLPFREVLNEADSSRTGTQSLFYSCSSLGESESAVRKITVNNVPKVFLTGSSETLALLDVTYSDDGAVCTDVEDGLITAWGANGLGSAQQLSILRVGYSGTVLDGVVENIFDGDVASSEELACESCVEVDSSSYIWLDLGSGKVVHSISLTASVTGASLKVGPQANKGPECKASVTESSLGSVSTIECDAPLAGRFVTLGGSSTSMKVCEISISGTVGPAAASRINITGSPSGCSGVDSSSFELAGQDEAGLGVLYSTQQAGSSGELRTDLGTGPTLQTELVAGYIQGTPDSERWILRNASGSEQAWAMGGESFPPLESSQWTVTSGEACTSLTFGVDPADSCSWLFGPSSEDGKYGCGDGSECDTEGCCSLSGGLARCPPDLPRMCVAQTCGGDYCCKTDCTSFDGNRVCQQNALSNSTGSGTLSRMEVVTSVLSDVAAIYKVTYTCYDSMGSHASVTRTVEVGCEEPNPGGTYGGNRVQCSTVNKTLEDVGTYEVCETSCLAASSSECVAYQYFDNKTCQFLTLCTGRYYMLANATDRQVAYCRRVDTVPTVSIEDGETTFLVGASSISVPDASCSDSEDGGTIKAPVVDSSAVNLAVPNNYQVIYTCTDSAGQSSSETLTVTVKDNCAVPDVTNKNTSTGYCLEGSTLAHGETCTSSCKAGFEARHSTHTCTTESDTDFDSFLDPTDYICDVLPCEEPVVANSAVDDGPLASAGAMETMV
ncbi:unnamed protein product [Durusdinium trenchii]|uniref:Pesticidal crystal protein Cry22Aa Ig-like domain-containing protein n=1 Tax=Durusdinium trenchii TaxID=1381693 RepID=A0ABP0QS76_9DINO